MASTFHSLSESKFGSLTESPLGVLDTVPTVTRDLILLMTWIDESSETYGAPYDNWLPDMDAYGSQFEAANPDYIVGAGVLHIEISEESAGAPNVWWPIEGFPDIPPEWNITIWRFQRFPGLEKAKQMFQAIIDSLARFDSLWSGKIPYVFLDMDDSGSMRRDDVEPDVQAFASWLRNKHPEAVIELRTIEPFERWLNSWANAIASVLP